MFPAADIPVAQISIQTSLGADHHLRIGAALAPLTRENVLIVGSGHMTHNLGEWISAARARGSMAIVECAPAPYVDEFRHWIDEALRDGDRTRLLRWRELAPHAVRAHPTPEHFLPLFVALGAAGANATVEHFDAGTDSAVLAMDAYLFRAQETVVA
jgi:4,5-DOPA dioxygenase extradiol